MIFYVCTIFQIPGMKKTHPYFFPGNDKGNKKILTTNYYTRKDDLLSKCRIFIPQSLRWVKNTGELLLSILGVFVKKRPPRSYSHATYLHPCSLIINDVANSSPCCHAVHKCKTPQVSSYGLCSCSKDSLLSLVVKTMF